MRKISNHHDLVTEKERLQQKLTLLKRELSSEVAEIKIKLQPVTKILGLFGAGVSNGTEPQSLLKRGANFGIDMLVGPRLAKAGWLARILVPPLLRGISSSVINKVKKFASKAA